MYNITDISYIDGNVELWGGKAVGLFCLKKNGFSVPKGFVIPCNIYEQYVNNMLDIAAFKRLLEEYINKYFGFDETLIFRSSANIEGVEGICCCGVFNSIIKSQNIMNDIKNIWDSVNSTEAISYFDLMRINVENVKMAIIIQKVEIGAISGVLHTYDLVNNCKGTIIEYEYQTLNAVVNGSNNAQMLIFDNNKKLIQGIYPQNISKQSLEDLINKSYEIEKVFLEPVELEFQLSNEEIYFTQVRKLL